VFGVGLAGGSQPALLVNGREVAANYAGEQQVNFVVPTDTAPGAAQLVIRNPRGSSQPASFNVVPAAPGIFFDPVTGAAGAVQRGGYLEIYCTGLGVPAAAPRVWIGSTEAPVVYAGAVPGLPGVNQVNVRIPGGLAGSAILRMASAGVESNHVRVDLR
jgi:uncharacterized protein (TIGR03437 family)